jgi:hypothetical protein
LVLIKGGNMSRIAVDLAKKCKIDFEDCEDHEDRCIKILYFQLMTEVIDRLGWHEHTSDWDPWIEVQFKDTDGVIVTEDNMTGYIDFDWVDRDGNRLIIEDGVKPGKLTICCDHRKIWGIKLWIDFDDKEQMPFKSGVISIDSLISMTHCY